MKSLAAAAVLLLVVHNSGLTSGQDIYQAGPYAVKHKLYLGSFFNWGVGHDVDVWAPEAGGDFPVIYFIPGVTG
jgi:hypothetical protein